MSLWSGSIRWSSWSPQLVPCAKAEAACAQLVRIIKQKAELKANLHVLQNQEAETESKWLLRKNVTNL